MSRAKMSTTCFPPGEEPKGKTELERFTNVMDRILSVSRDELDKRIKKHDREQHRKKRKRRVASQ